LHNPYLNFQEKHCPDNSHTKNDSRLKSNWNWN